MKKPAPKTQHQSITDYVIHKWMLRFYRREYRKWAVREQFGKHV